MAEPKVELSLLVPSTRCGGRPAVNKAGVVNSPPPPAMASMKPATKATKARMARVERSTLSSKGMGSAYSAGAERGCGEGQHLTHLYNTKPMWERACSRWRCDRQQIC
ncbi:hypothetical protein D9M69_664160 [compost metagenome]